MNVSKKSPKKKAAAPATAKSATRGEAPEKGAAAFAKVVRALREEEGVEEPKPTRREFGSNGLKVRGKIFAMLVRGAFVVKLPKERVNELVAAGKGTHFDPGRGKLMKEWFSTERSEGEWLELAREALSFVGARR